MTMGLIHRQTYRRATLIVALFFGVAAAKPAGSTETYQDIIEKAYNLSLQKDRTQAIALLLGALKKESKKTTAQKELSAAIEQVSKVFYSDKAQQLHELALSLKSTDPGLALSKLQEAARLEPENTSIEVALMRLSLSNGDCAATAGRLLKQKDLASVLEDYRLVSAQTALCQGKFSDYLGIRAGIDMKNSSLAPFWQTAEMEYLYRTAAFAKAQEAALNLQKVDAGFPEALYWQWKAELELKLKPDKVAQKYLNQCKTMNSRQVRLYLPEPMLCRRTTEVETFLKKNNNSEI
jgi:hypothetical protein